MQKAAWTTVIESAADPQRAGIFFERLKASAGVAFFRKASPEQGRILAALFSGSQALSELVVAHPEWLPTALDAEGLQRPRQLQGIHRELGGLLRPLLQSSDFFTALQRIRDFKQREMFRIAARDLARLADATEITLELSHVADVCLAAVYDLCRRQLVERLGEPYHQDADGSWQKTEFAVFGMGKLGGQELNYSSDVDLLFAYSEEGHAFKEPPRKNSASGKGLPSYQFFKRLAEAFISEVSRMTPEGSLYRIDMRLRPEGKAGPLARSLNSYENYYAQWGQTWERMMLIKARRVAGDEALASEFLEMVQPFRYPRSVNERIFAEVAATKQRIESEVVRLGEIDRNVKLGRGGIREIEFLAQALQLFHAGRSPFLQGSQTLPTLQKLVQYELLAEADAQTLTQAYLFLREVEHRLQMENNLQTHTIPTERKARERLAALMECQTLEEFEKELRRHTQNVRSIYERWLQSDHPTPHSPLPGSFEGAETEWKRLLESHSFRDVERAVRTAQEFIKGPGYVHVSARTEESARTLFTSFLSFCPRRSGGGKAAGPNKSPREAERRTLFRRERGASTGRAGSEAGASLHSGTGVQAPPQSLPESIGGGERVGKTSEGKEGPKLEAQEVPGHQKPGVVLSDPDRVMVRLDSFVAAYGARATLYELWTSNPSLFRLLLLLFDRSEFLAEIAIRTPDLVDELELSGRLRRRKNAGEILEDLRRGREDTDQRLWLRRYHQAELMRLGLRDILELADFEQNLAELSALADACLQYALEIVLRKYKIKSAPFAIIGLGKLGGSEINYGSDLDIIFVAEDQPKDLPQQQKLAAEIMDLLSSPTELGVAFQTDARLRPDGEKGLLVNTLAAYEEYYRVRAQLWEIQALTRTRSVAGNERRGEEFQKLAATLANFAQPPQPLTAFTPDWKKEIARMRQRIEKERTPAGKQALAIKTGAGGLIDAEFIAQALALEHGWHEANTLRALQHGLETGALPRTDGDKLIENYRKVRRIEGILRRWSYEGETELPDDPAPLYRVAVRCGFPNADEFMRAVTAYRQAIREVYVKVFPA